MKKPKTRVGTNSNWVQKRAVRGVAALTGKTFLLQLISSVGFFLLSVFLGKEQIGLFFAVSEIVAILGYFSDIGLAAALIQKKGKLKWSEVRSTFTIQEGIVGLLLLIVILLSAWIFRFYSLSGASQWLFWALLAGFFLASLKTIPSVLLERKLKFTLLVTVEVVENFVFYLVSVFSGFSASEKTSER
ncbi:oligosaccharide flippase family protein [Patescibacteria group bacterium]